MTSTTFRRFEDGARHGFDRLLDDAGNWLGTVWFCSANGKWQWCLVCHPAKPDGALDTESAARTALLAALNGFTGRRDYPAMPVAA